MPRPKVQDLFTKGRMSPHPVLITAEALLQNSLSSPGRPSRSALLNRDMEEEARAVLAAGVTVPRTTHCLSHLLSLISLTVFTFLFLRVPSRGPSPQRY